MSLILDALKKAESERKRDEGGELPSIESNPDSEIVANTTTPVSGKNWLLPSSLFFAAVMVAVLAYIVFSNSNADSQNTEITTKPAVEKSTAQIRPASANSVNTRNVVKSALTEDSLKSYDKPIDAVAEKSKQKVESIKSELIASQYRDQPQQKEEIKNLYNTQSRPVADAQDGANTQLKPETKPKNQITVSQSPSNAENLATENKIPSNQKAIQKVTQNTTQDATQHTKQNKTAESTSLTAYSDTKRITDLPFSVQSDIPTMMYTNHQYKGERNSRVEINGKLLRENSNAASGVKLKKILQDGIILQFKEHEFKMQALNSWINL